MISTAASAKADRFELGALQQARNYRRALVREFEPFLRGLVIEIGAGIGQMTQELVTLPAIERLVSIEPDPALCELHRARLPGHDLLEGFIEAVPPESPCDAILSVNVLEHIEADAQELAKYACLLRKQSGHLCLFVPARPELYAPIDRDFGHFRRYTRPELRRKLTAAGFAPVRLVYFNLLGYFAWWFSFCLLKKRAFGTGAVRAFDRAVFPAGHFLESKLRRPPFGQSLLAVARASPGLPSSEPSQPTRSAR